MRYNPDGRTHAALLFQQAACLCSERREIKAECRSRLACENATCRKTSSQFDVTGAKADECNRCAEEVALSANVDLILEG
jgi:hypothetical protein